MTCDEFARIFYADLARGCSREMRAAASRHAAGCASCAARLAHESSVAAAMGVSVPRERRVREARAGQRRTFALVTVAVLAAVVLAIQGGVFPRIAALAASSATIANSELPAPSAYQAPPGASGDPIAAESMARARAASEAADRALAESVPAVDPSKLVPGSFDEALHLYRTGRFKLAAVAFHAVAPPTAEAGMWAARSVRASGGFAAAALLFGEVAAANSRTTVGDDALLEVGRCYRATGQVELARQWLRPLRATPSHAARAQEELDGIDRDLGLARKRAERAERHAPVLAPRGINPRSTFE